MASEWLAAVAPGNQVPAWKSFLTKMDFNIGIS